MESLNNKDMVNLLPRPLFADDALDPVHQSNIYFYAVQSGAWDPANYASRTQSMRAFRQQMENSTGFRVEQQNAYNDWVTRMSIVHDDIESNRRRVDPRMFNVVAARYNEAMLNRTEF